MNIDAISVNEDIPGVLPARQARSRRIRDAYIEAGIKLLNSMRFNDLKVSDLAQECGQSVGSFYTRFEDKEAYFRALRAAAIGLCNLEIHGRIGGDKLYEMEPEEALDELVDLMADLFTGPVRGVLRESLLRILEPDDPWAPMRDSAREIMRNYRRACGTQFPAFDPAETQTRLSFCFQLVVGALQNDLVNDYHVFSTKDQSLRKGLKEVVRSYMRAGREPRVNPDV